MVFVFAFFSIFDTPTTNVAIASDEQYSDVLFDLQKDERFTASDYPMDIKDYSLELIQIAEGTDGFVYVYVYQPSADAKDYRASSINVSTSINNALAPRNYKLEYCNSNGVFFKYKISNLKVSENNIRFYTIVSVFRPFDETVDEKAGGGNIITEVPFAVSKQYAFGTVNGQPYVECVDIETIEVTEKFVGFVRYPNGYTYGSVESCDSHFVAFNTDKPMDKLLEADVYYTTQKCKVTDSLVNKSTDFYGDVTEEYAYLKYTQKGGNSEKGWFAKSYSWDRIQTVDDFIAETDGKNTIYSGAIISVSIGSELNETARAELKNKKWVLRFVETSYSYIHPVAFTNIYYSTVVGNVTILRLKFETDGIVYNLGVIDNKQTGSMDPVNKIGLDVELNENIKDALEKLLMILLIITLIVLIAPLFVLLIKGLGQIFIKQRARKKARRKKNKEKKKQQKEQKKLKNNQKRRTKEPRIQQKHTTHKKVGRRKKQ